MKTVQLKEISGYLPYNLKCKIQKGIIASLGGITVVNNYWEFVAVFEGYGEYGSATFKPILRPLSDLVKPCLEDGKIPIVELAKIEDLLPSERIRIDENGDIICRLFLNKDNKRILTPVHFMYDLKEGVFKITCDTWHQMSVLTQKQLQEKLYEWHFWLGDQDRFGKDIIDINTLKL
jgi:hypothetical protein